MRRQRTGRLRRTLVLVGLIPALAAVLFALKVATMVHRDDTGRAFLDRGDPGRAVVTYAGNGRVNVLEPWVAPFGEGTALLLDGRYGDALGPLEEALGEAPSRRRCAVLVNLAIAQEGLGDDAGRADPGQAAARWRAGRAAIAAGSCTDDREGSPDVGAVATRVDDRLVRKLEDARSEDPASPTRTQPPAPEPSPEPEPTPEVEAQEDRLARRAEKGDEERRAEQERQERREREEREQEEKSGRGAVVQPRW